jgi:hypothetical protein
MKKIESMEIKPGVNGGASITHRFAREASNKGNRSMGDIYMERPSEEVHNFGPGDGAAMMGHVAEHMNMKPGKMAKGAACPMCGGGAAA